MSIHKEAIRALQIPLYMVRGYGVAGPGVTILVSLILQKYHARIRGGFHWSSAFRDNGSPGAVCEVTEIEIGGPPTDGGKVRIRFPLPMVILVVGVAGTVENRRAYYLPIRFCCGWDIIGYKTRPGISCGAWGDPLGAARWITLSDF